MLGLDHAQQHRGEQRQQGHQVEAQPVPDEEAEHRQHDADRLELRNRHDRLVPRIRCEIPCNRTGAIVVKSCADMAPARKSLRRELQENKTMRLILLVLVIILLVGALPAWPYSAGW